MLSNLKLGSLDTSITLTPADTNVTGNFILPRVLTTSVSSPNTPTVAGPVTGDTGSGETNYGYLYNWPAATAGATTTSNPAGSFQAASSICPLGWRLPSGGYNFNEFGELDIAFGGTGYFNEDEVSAANWQFNGPFRGVLSGYWDAGSYISTLDYGYYWSGSAYPSDSMLANNIYIDGMYANPSLEAMHRTTGLAIRCMKSSV